MKTSYTINDIIQFARAWKDNGNRIIIATLIPKIDSFIEFTRAENGNEKILFIYDTPESISLDRYPHNSPTACTVIFEIREKTILFNMIAKVSKYESIEFSQEVMRDQRICSYYSSVYRIDTGDNNIINPSTSYVQYILDIWASKILTPLIKWYDDVYQEELKSDIYKLFKQGTPEIIHSMFAKKIITEAMAKEWLTLREEMINGKAYPNMNHCIE